MQVRHPHAFSPQRIVCRILSRANNLLVGRFVHQFKDSVSVRRSCPLHATGGPLLRFGYEARQQICFRKVCVRSRVCFRALSSQVCVVISPRLCVMRVWASELELRRPYVIAHRALPFASAAQQQAPAPRGPILSELASVNGRGGGVLLEQGAPKLQKQKTPPRRGGAPGGKLPTAAFALAPADIFLPH